MRTNPYRNDQLSGDFLKKNTRGLVVIFMLIMTPFSAWAHRVNAGLTVIEYNHDASELQITHRLYVHDFEKIIRKHEGRTVTFEQVTKEFIGAYCKNHFALALDGNVAELTYVGSETEAEYVFIYFTTPTERPAKSAIIWNTLLFDEFPSQVNLTNFHINGKTLSAILTADQTTKTLALVDQ